MTDYRLGVLKSMILKLMCLVLGIVTLVGVFILVYKPAKVEHEAWENAYAGEIVNKEVVNAYAGIFTSRDTDYQLVIDVEYEHNGEIKHTDKNISVDKDTYKDAEIGDWFNSHTLEVTKKK